MKIPRRVQILNSVYIVRFDRTISATASGETSFDDRVIKLDPALKKGPRQILLEVLWHEVVHAYHHESGMNEFLATQAREMACETLSRLVVNLTGGEIG